MFWRRFGLLSKFLDLLLDLPIVWPVNSVGSKTFVLTVLSILGGLHNLVSVSLMFSKQGDAVETGSKYC